MKPEVRQTFMPESTIVTATVSKPSRRGKGPSYQMDYTVDPTPLSDLSLPGFQTEVPKKEPSPAPIVSSTLKITTKTETQEKEPSTFSETSSEEEEKKEEKPQEMVTSFKDKVKRRQSHHFYVKDFEVAPPQPPPVVEPEPPKEPVIEYVEKDEVPVIHQTPIYLKAPEPKFKYLRKRHALSPVGAHSKLSDRAKGNLLVKR